MRKTLLCSLILLLLSVSSFVAICSNIGSKGDGFLQAMSAKIRSMGPYEVHFRLLLAEEQGGAVTGRYTVDDDRYMLAVAGQVIYGDSDARYTINHADREVVIEKMQSSTPMLIANPALAFLELDKVLNSNVVAPSRERKISLLLTPRSKEVLFRSSSLVIDSVTNLPMSISYNADEEEVVVEIESIRSTSQSTISIPQLLNSIEIPSGYSIIDIR